MDNKALFEKLFNKNFSDDGNKQLLEAVAKEYPYFTAAQFYLLQQAAAGSEEFSTQAAKTSVLFNDPHWLNFQLLQTNKQPVTEDPTNDEQVIANQQPETSSIESDTPMKFELKIPAEKPGDE